MNPISLETKVKISKGIPSRDAAIEVGEILLALQKGFGDRWFNSDQGTDHIGRTIGPIWGQMKYFSLSERGI